MAIYCRISTDEDLQRYSVANQEAALLDYARRRGWEVVGKPLKDRISGSKASRPGFNALLDLLAEGAVEAVLVTEQDRLSRLDEIPWALLKQTFRDTGAKMYTLSGEVDFGNEDQEFTADILALIDRRRRKTIVRQMVRGRVGAAKRGEWPGRPPYGYRRDKDTGHLVPVEEEAIVMREIFAVFAQEDVGSYRLATMVQSRVARKCVDQSFILEALRNPAYVGDLSMEIGGESIFVPGAHPAIVSRDLWEHCNRILAERGTIYRKARLNTTVGLVSGMVYCACGNLLSATTARQTRQRKKKGTVTHTYHYYRHVRGHRKAGCSASHRVELVDDKVRGHLTRLATSPAAARKLIRQVGDPKAARELEARTADLKGQADSLGKKRERLLPLYLTGEWDKKTLDAEKKKLERELAIIHRELAQTQTKLRLARSEALDLELVAEAFAAAADLESLPLKEQQAILRGLVVQVTVSLEGEPTITARNPKLPAPAEKQEGKKLAQMGVRAGQSSGETEFLERQARTNGGSHGGSAAGTAASAAPGFLWVSGFRR